MEANITERRYSDDELPLAEPHFDEEATLLGAQPVVPLKEIREIREIRDARPEAVSKKRLAFGLSILASLIIGALGATVVFRQRGQRSATEIVDNAIAGSDAIASDSTESPVLTGGQVSSGAIPETKAAEAKTPTVVLVAEKKQRLIPPDKPELESEELSLAEEREIRRAERIEARRLRRMAAREERNGSGRRRKRAGDLLRIREIFEGSRRP